MDITHIRIFDSIIAFLGGIATLLFLFSPKMKKNKLWTVTVTPLASIIGSGFLIVAPIMYKYFKSLSLPLIVLITVFAYFIGSAIRYNIRYFDLREERWTRKFFSLLALELGSNLILGISYIIAVAFYASILSAFAFEIFGISLDETLFGIPVVLVTKLMTTGILAFVGLRGFKKGLHELEKLEKIAVDIKLGVIVSLLISLILYFFFSMKHLTPTNYIIELVKINPESLAVLGGILLITQGFETVKYMGDDYSAPLRIKAMRYAQIIAALIYIIFVPLAGPISKSVHHATETAIISMLSQTAVGMGFVLSVAAIFSQFGAVVADTIGNGGLLEEVTNRKVNEKQAYLLSSVLAIGLTWFFDILEIVALASRFFALYYFFQVLIAVIVSFRRKDFHRTLYFIPVDIILLLIVFFAKSAH